MKILLSLSILCCCTLFATAIARGERSNIIMFLIDDQNPSSIAAFGGDTYTPHLNRMAEEGMKFTRAYVSSSVCTSSRYSFLTGRFAGSLHSKRYAGAVGGVDPVGAVEPIPDGKAKKKAKREACKKARGEAKSGNEND